jgi:hypothetical protein
MVEIEYVYRLTTVGMEKIRQLIIRLILIGGLSSCVLGSDFKLEMLYRQRIANSSKVIYSFYFSASLPTAGDWTGQVIMDSAEKFPSAVNTRGDLDELPYYSLFDGKITGEKIKMLGIEAQGSAEGDTLLSPLSHEQRKYSGVMVDATRYKETYGSAIDVSLQEYQFGSFVETRDSLIFYGVTRKFGRGLPDIVAFIKGNIKVVDSANGVINHIEVGTILIGRGDIYKPGKPFELVHDRPVIGEQDIWFYPKQPTPSARMTDYGIYKAVVIGHRPAHAE